MITQPCRQKLISIPQHLSDLVAGDGPPELDTNTVERTIQPLTLDRENGLFTGALLSFSQSGPSPSRMD